MPKRLAALLSLPLFIFTACSRDEVRTYRVPKEAAPELPATASTPAAPASSAELTWQAPDHWEELPASGMRRGSFTLRGDGEQTADLSLIAFPGDVGGLAANVNRWRGQVGLGPLSAAQVDASIQHADTAYFHVDFVSMEGEAAGVPTRIEGAIFSHAGESWFVKLMGPTALVTAETNNFKAFVETIAPSNR